MADCFRVALMRADLRQVSTPRCHCNWTSWVCRPPVRQRHGKHRIPACRAAKQLLSPLDVKFSMDAVRKCSSMVLTELGHSNLLPLVENGELCTLVGLHPAEAVTADQYAEVKTCCRHPYSVSQAAGSPQSTTESLGGSDSSPA